MSSLNDLVPPLELCKLIPAGSFADSAFVWYSAYNPLTKSPLAVVMVRPPITLKYYEEHPAPTLQEIMADMQYCRVYKKTANFYVAVKEKDRVVSFNSATAALKLWLKLKGIGYEQ